MKLTHYVILNLNRKDIELLTEKASETACCWNDIVNISYQYYKDNHEWISNYSIQPLLQHKYNLSADTVIGISDKFCTNRYMTATCRKIGLKTKYPYKQKRYYCISLKKSNFKRIDNTLRIMLAKKQYIFIQFPDELDDIPTYGEITYKNDKYVFYYTVNIDEKKPVISDISMGIYLGEIHTISATTNIGDSLIITNRIGRSYKRYRNKKVAEIQSKLKKCKKGSNRYKKLIKNKKFICNKTTNKLKNLYHQTTAKTIKFATKHNVSEIICGNCKGVEKNTKKDHRLNVNSRQKISQFEYGTIIQQLKYKSNLNGIQFHLVEESYTSQKCPVCGHKHKTNNRTYKCCKCGYTNHRDINGAWNILNKKYNYDVPDSFNIIGIHPIKMYL